MFKDQEIEARLKALKDEYETKVAELKASEALLAEKEKAVKELAAAKEALKAAQKKHDDIVAQIDKALGKPKRAKAVKTPKVASEDGAVVGRTSKKKEKILAALSAVFPEGLTISELETKTGEKNLGVWFATTGKKVVGINKLARGSYAYNAAIDPATPAPTPSPASELPDLSLSAQPLFKSDPTKPGKC